jgi:hypothetical protein
VVVLHCQAVRLFDFRQRRAGKQPQDGIVVAAIRRGARRVVNSHPGPQLVDVPRALQLGPPPAEPCRPGRGTQRRGAAGTHSCHAGVLVRLLVRCGAATLWAESGVGRRAAGGASERVYKVIMCTLAPGQRCNPCRCLEAGVVARLVGDLGTFRIGAPLTRYKVAVPIEGKDSKAIRQCTRPSLRLPHVWNRPSGRRTRSTPTFGELETARSCS